MEVVLPTTNYEPKSCPAAPAIDPTKKSSLFEVPVSNYQPPVKPKLGPFIAIIDAILAEDKRCITFTLHYPG
jgi:hypothetical protein